MVYNMYPVESTYLYRERDKRYHRGVYRDYYIDHQNKELPHIEFDNIEYLNIMRLRWNYIPNDVIYDVMYRKLPELFEE